MSISRLTKHSWAVVVGVVSAVVILIGVLLPQVAAAGDQRSYVAKPTIVLVHGAWADGSSWAGVVNELQEHGFTVLVPPNPLRGPIAGGDAAYLASFLNSVSGPVVLVGHSYGGFVITNAATGNANVKALVYVDAYIPDLDQPLGLLTARSCLNVDTSKSFRPIPYTGGVDLYVQQAPNPPYAGFAACFANGVGERQASVLFATQRPLSAAALTDPSGPPAWATIPSWSLIGTQDRVIPPRDQLAMSHAAHAHVSTFNAGHLGLITDPDAVATTIITAADATAQQGTAR